MIIIIIYFFMKIIFIACSGMFRVPGFIDAHFFSHFSCGRRQALPFSPPAEKFGKITGVLRATNRA